MSYPFNSKVAAAKGSPIRAFNEEIAGIKDLVKFSLGEPDYPVPAKVKAALIQAVEDDLSSYTHSRGTLELRQAISRYIERHYHTHYRPEDEIIVAHGATGALFSTLTALLNQGDQVIAPAPYYVAYKTQVELNRAEFIPLDTSQNNFRLTPADLETAIQAHPRTKLILLNHPSNPTGVTYNRQELQALAQVIQKHDLLVVSDEIYAQLTYDHAHISMAELLPDQTILINGASKSHAMVGWRMGIIAGPKVYLDQIFKVQQASINTPVTPIQKASIVAYDQCDEDIQAMVQAYRKRRDYLLKALAPLGFAATEPQGAFYLFVKVPDWFKGTDYDFCLQVAQKVAVGLTPGSSFGEAGQGYFRISYAASMENLHLLIDRLTQFQDAYLQSNQ
ncbi:aminotransferase class I/II-fold pyridoxal phosphate-dependent enzyme [Eremococcus coleocola]|uniref:Aminotransferase n=1 Tax=Eremococcus coleocola ACS-139-V-Col8 TaxID=908337 RepID=E4KR01_9LACT|nr:aminotransferase class I/II-fold pyridoxal phosphate-dependent enzyme [Eremococcus coleocola]EFR30628.1 putative aromatic-amino-acid transaminase [Eremococcus coleocola ACS-139-V-Col8]